MMSGGEGFKNEHPAVGEGELDVARIAGRCGISWHGHGKLEIFHIRGHNCLGIEADQCVATELWRGLGGQDHPQISG
uniref:Uncharacterized protein n=1 Tax=Romanomermis culicivorax TaxID=13658 RepID=A0A915KHC6_ROMCU